MHLHEILDIELQRFDGRPLHIVETGTIRGNSERSKIGDGWSTLWFARRTANVPGGSFTSIDLDVSTAKEVLSEHGLLECAHLIEGHSIYTLASLASNARRWSTRWSPYDVAFLDSDNDAMLILHEFMIAQTLVEPGGLIIIDDVHLPHHPTEGVRALKGDLVWPYVRDQNLRHHIAERHGWNGYRAGVLIVERGE